MKQELPTVLSSDNSYIQEAFINATTKMISDLFWNTCECLRNDPEKENVLNPDFHLDTCPYAIHMTEVGIKFNDRED